jgi:C4-dicarboxylate transporter DctQ subunit
MSDTVLEQGRFAKTLELIENTIVTAALGIMIMVIFLQIVLRYFSAMDLPVLGGLMDYVRDGAQSVLPWSEEVARYAMIWAVFVGAGMGAKTGVHVGVDALVRLLPPEIMKYAVIFGGLCSVLFCLALTCLGAILLDMMWKTGQVSPALEIPMIWAYLSVPVGGALTALRFFQAMVNKVRSLNAGQVSA